MARFTNEELRDANREMRKMSGCDRYLLATCVPGTDDRDNPALYELCRKWCNEHNRKHGTYY